MKKRVVLKESQIRRIVDRAVKSVLKEGGHLYWIDDEGRLHTNSKVRWRGVKGAIYVWHGEWSDPEIIWKGHSLNYWDVEEGLWLTFKNECEDMGETPNESDFEAWADRLDESYLSYHLDDYIQDGEDF